MSAPAPSSAPDAPHQQNIHGQGLAVLALAALGVVYGDIGTSPLYAIKECFHEGYGLAPSPANVLGILALLALLEPASRPTSFLITFGLFGSALLYGDGVITPAISVLSAVEGLEVAAPTLSPWVLPITVLILGALFFVQRRSTAGVGAVFGPLTLARSPTEFFGIPPNEVVELGAKIEV